MYAERLALLCLLSLTGCDNMLVPNTDGGSGTADANCPSPPDMTTPAAKCAAAKGLSGDLLSDLCLDMDKVDTQGLTNRGFNLTASMQGCSGWEITSGKLQPKAFAASGMAKCELLLPKIPVDQAKYPRVTLALIHQASFSNTMQQAKIELPIVIGTPLGLWINPAMAVDQRTIIEIDTSKIPSGPDAQASFQLLQTAATTAPSWTISSIAVLGQATQ
jgi:hypothetical protein